MTTKPSARSEQTAQTKVDVPSAEIALESAVEDFENLSDVYSWLAHLFFEIGQQCKNKNDPQSAMIALHRIQTMSDMGNYLAINWMETSTSMRRSAVEVLDRISKAEANHG